MTRDCHLDTRAAAPESGSAMIAAVVITVLVAGLAMVMVSWGVHHSGQSRVENQRTASLYWTEAAFADLGYKLDTLVVGRATAIQSAIVNVELWTVPKSGNWDAAHNAFVVDVTRPDGTTEQGYYQILAPAPGIPDSTVMFDANPALDATSQGSVTVLVRGWSSVTDSRPRVVRAVLARGTLARYSLLSDAPIRLLEFGNAALRGDVHTNNAGGAATGINGGDQTVYAPARVTTRAGKIMNLAGCGGGRCKANTGEFVPFTHVDTAFNQIDVLSSRGAPWCQGHGVLYGVACSVTTPPLAPLDPPGAVPVYRVEIEGTCVRFWPAWFPRQRDTRGVRVLDDKVAPTTTTGGGVSQWCPGLGGGAIRFPSTIVVRGVATVPMTIMARSAGAAIPASILLHEALPLQTPALVGGANEATPLGLVAQGAVFLPSYAMGVNRRVQNTALVAQGAELSLGPEMLSIVGSMDPCNAARMGLGSAKRITISGSIMTRRRPVLRYSDPDTPGTCTIGYRNRTFLDVPRLRWDPPPLFPTDRNWHVASSREVGAA